MEQSKKVAEKAPLGLTDSQWDAISKLRAPEDAEIPTTEASRPTSVYLSEARFKAEMRDLFKKVPVVAAPSAYLPEPGMSLPQDCYGVPLLLTRDRNGVAHAFINACRHRGSKLVEGDKPVKAGRVSCPYHAWTYGMDGALVGIPRQETFPSAKKCDLGLVALTCYESGGFIWVGLDPDYAPEQIEGTDQVAEDLESFGLDKMHVYGRRMYDLKTNWKFVMEPFLEAYHIQRLHANSIASMFVDVPSVYTHLGDHQRQTSGKANFKPEMLQEEVDNLHKFVTHAYLVFPNTVVITSPYYFSVMILMPRAKDRTVVDYYMLVKGPADSEKAEALYAKSFALIDEVFGGEDFRAAELQQEGMNSGAIKEVYFGGLEEMIGPFHDSIESYLAPEDR